MEPGWDKLSPDEKLERRFAAWLGADGLDFVSPEAKAAYEARATRIRDAILLRKTPDRVPVNPSVAHFPAYYAGLTPRDVMYDADKAIDVWTKCNLEFEPDAKFGIGVIPGQVWEIVDMKLYDWPGHGLPPDQPFQFVEGEYMKADEYDALINDPSDYWLRAFMPRTMSAFQPFSALSPFIYLRGGAAIHSQLARFGQPSIQEALAKLAEAGRVAMAWQQKLGRADRRLEEMGFPGFMGASTIAPFDFVGDALRGTRGVCLDMYRRPAKLHEAMKRLTPIMIQMGVSGSRLGACPIVSIPLHKGADGFMSDDQFKEFYWPTLHELILGLVEEGLVPRIFAEGGYNTRLETIRDVPKGKTIWYFDYSDMARVKEALLDVACIMGNVPVALIHTGTPEATTAYCKQLIDTAGRGGGFILATGAGIERGRPENLRAMIESAKEFGWY